MGSCNKNTDFKLDPKIKELMKNRLPDFSIEKNFNQSVIGIDEVGRGPIAGPVVSCAFIFFDLLMELLCQSVFY